MFICEKYLLGKFQNLFVKDFLGFFFSNLINMLQHLFGTLEYIRYGFRVVEYQKDCPFEKMQSANNNRLHTSLSLTYRSLRNSPVSTRYPELAVPLLGCSAYCTPSISVLVSGCLVSTRFSTSFNLTCLPTGHLYGYCVRVVYFSTQEFC